VTDASEIASTRDQQKRPAEVMTSPAGPIVPLHLQFNRSAQPDANLTPRKPMEVQFEFTFEISRPRVRRGMIDRFAGPGVDREVRSSNVSFSL
jgi:hypothetical protein